MLPAVLKDFGDINACLAAIVLPTGQLPDVLVWSHAPDAVLTSKLAFYFLPTRNTVLPWAEQIWSFAIPHSHSCIYWRLHHGKMLTDENLRSCGCIVVSVCSLCLTLEESSNHLFLRCQFETQFGNWIGDMLNCVIDRSSIDTILSFRPIRCSSQVSDIFLAAILHTLHSLWWARNPLRFTNVKPTLHSTKVRIHSFISMSGNVSKGKCMHSDFPFLDTFTVSLYCRRVKDVVQVLWKPLTTPWLKVNTDGSVLGGFAACGGAVP